MEKIQLHEEGLLANYLSLEPSFNIYMLSDLDNYGLNHKDVIFFADKDRMGLNAVLMKFYDSFVLYSKDNIFNKKEILTQIDASRNKEASMGCLTGKMSSLLRLHTGDSLACRKTFIMELHKENFYSTCLNNTAEVVKIAENEVEHLLETYCEVPEMHMKYASVSQEGIEDIRRTMKTGRIYAILRDGRIVSSIATTAENDKYGMLINVCTIPEYRRHGFCMFILCQLCNDLFQEGKKSIYIYYENPLAGRIYQKTGFRFAGEYGRVGLDALLKAD